MKIFSPPTHFVINELSIEDYSGVAAKLKDCLKINDDEDNDDDDDHDDDDDDYDDHLLIRAGSNKLSFGHLQHKGFKSETLS